LSVGHNDEEDKQMSHFCERALLLLGFPFLIFLHGCSSSPECDSIETRTALLQNVLDDHANALASYAARNSTENKGNMGNPGPDAAKSANPERAKPQYLLGQRMVTISAAKDKRTLKCSGGISASVGDIKVTKEIDFTVQRSSDGKISVSVDPFEF
jgi:hypothetical protein